jgi:hypothetical protein
MEISDFFGSKRKIIFDMDDEDDRAKAKKVLKPKGIRESARSKKAKPKRYRKTKHLAKPTKKRKNLKKNLPKIAPTEKKRKKSQKQAGLSITFAKKKIKVLPVYSSVLNEKIQKTEVIQTKPVIDALPKQISRKITEKKPEKEKFDVIEEKKPETLTITAEMIAKFGNGGNLESVCPICADDIAFHYDNLDERRLSSTRMCSCGAIARISIQSHHKSIFKDLGITAKSEFVKRIKKVENNVFDEFNNAIFTYAFNQEN